MSSAYLAIPWWAGGRVDDLDFKLFHEQDGYNRTDGVTHDCTKYLFIMLTMEKEIQVGPAEAIQQISQIPT